MQGCVTSLPIRNPLRPHAVAGTAPSKGRPSRPGDRCRGHYSTAGFAPAARVLSLTGRTRTEPLLPIALRREASTQGGTEPPHRDQSQSRPRSSLASIQVAEGGQISRRLEWCGVPMRTVEARSKLGTLGRSLLIDIFEGLSRRSTRTGACGFHADLIALQYGAGTCTYSATPRRCWVPTPVRLPSGGSAPRPTTSVRT